MDQIKELYCLKDESVGPPSRYLGANVGKFQLRSGLECWSALAQDYVKSAVCNIEEVLAQDPIPSKLKNRVNCPLPISYRPKVDVSPLLDSKLTTRLQNGFGVLRWIVELGRIEIDDRCFKAVDWKDFYPEAVDKLPPGMPEPLGLPVEISCFVDADHAGNLLTC